MSSNTKILLSAGICAIVATLLFLVIPITGTFFVSYLFALIAIGSIVGTVLLLGKGKENSIAELSYVYSACVYGIVNILFSIVACLIPISLTWTIAIHVALLAFFVIRLLLLSVGSEYINKLDDEISEKRKEFQAEKNKYWDK